MLNLTAKELTALEEQLDLEQLLVKKYDTMAQQVTDIGIKTKLEQISAKHQQHYDSLLTFLG